MFLGIVLYSMIFNMFNLTIYSSKLKIIMSTEYNILITLQNINIIYSHYVALLPQCTYQLCLVLATRTQVCIDLLLKKQYINYRMKQTWTDFVCTRLSFSNGHNLGHWNFFLWAIGNFPFSNGSCLKMRSNKIHQNWWQQSFYWNILSN